MSKPSWPDSLTRILERLSRPERPLRIAVLGVGQELNGDDAAGVLVVRALLRHHWGAAADRLLLIDAGPAPESATGALRRFGPDLVLLIDAAQFGATPGDVRLIEWQAAGGLSASSHTLPLSILAGYLAAELGSEVALLGIQPEQTSLDAPLSPAAAQAVGQIAWILAEILR